MSSQNKGRVLPQRIDNQTVALMVSKSLRIEHTGDTSAIKNIGANTGANLNTISKWYQAANTPQSAHLLVLARIYPQVLRGILELIGREDIWRAGMVNVIPEKIVPITSVGHIKNRIYSDKSVRVKVEFGDEIVMNLNRRQLWFVGEIGNGNRIGARELALKWRKSVRTSRRDIKKLVELGIVYYCGPPKVGYYVVNKS